MQTKWAAEQLVRLGRERGIPIDLYRPGRILGDSRTGAALTTHFTTRVIKGCIQLGLVPRLDLRIEMTPVDYVASALVAIVARAKRARRRPTTWSTVARWPSPSWPTCSAGAGRSGRFRSSSGGEALRACYGERDNELHPVMGVVEEFIVGGEEAVDYGVQNTEKALRGTGVDCPPLDARLLETYLDWMTRTGYLPAPTPANS